MPAVFLTAPAARAATGQGGLATGAAPAAADARVRNRVVADAEIVAEADPSGATRLPVLRSQAPLVLRRTPEAVYLVGAAAGPLGGDLLSLRITVGPDAFLRVRTAAASIALPGVDGAESVFSVTADVAPGGRLEYLPEPLVVSANARLATDFRITLAEDSSLVLREEILLGRHGEPGGAARTSLRVDHAGRPLLRQALEVSGEDEASLGPAVLSGHRAIGTLLRAGTSAGTGTDTTLETGAVSETSAVSRAGTVSRARAASGAGAGPGSAVMPLAGPGVLVTALADDAVTLRRRLRFLVM